MDPFTEWREKVLQLLRAYDLESVVTSEEANERLNRTPRYRMAAQKMLDYLDTDILVSVISQGITGNITAIWDWVNEFYSVAKSTSEYNGAPFFPKTESPEQFVNRFNHFTATIDEPLRTQLFLDQLWLVPAIQKPLSHHLSLYTMQQDFIDQMNSIVNYKK